MMNHPIPLEQLKEELPGDAEINASLIEVLESYSRFYSMLHPMEQFKVSKLINRITTLQYGCVNPHAIDQSWREHRLAELNEKRANEGGALT